MSTSKLLLASAAALLWTACVDEDQVAPELASEIRVESWVDGARPYVETIDRATLDAEAVIVLDGRAVPPDGLAAPVAGLVETDTGVADLTVEPSGALRIDTEEATYVLTPTDDPSLWDLTLGKGVPTVHIRITPGDPDVVAKVLGRIVNGFAAAPHERKGVWAWVFGALRFAGPWGMVIYGVVTVATYAFCRANNSLQSCMQSCVDKATQLGYQCAAVTWGRSCSLLLPRYSHRCDHHYRQNPPPGQPVPQAVDQAVPAVKHLEEDVETEEPGEPTECEIAQWSASADFIESSDGDDAPEHCIYE